MGVHPMERVGTAVEVTERTKSPDTRVPGSVSWPPIAHAR
jgi:hypothetical protein